MDKDLEERLSESIIVKEVNPTELQALSDVKDFFIAEDDGLNGRYLEKSQLYKLVKAYQTAFAYREEKAKY